MTTIFIKGKWHVKRTLQFIDMVIICHNVIDFQIDLLFVNILLVQLIIVEQNFYSCWLYLTCDNWKYYKDFLIPSCKLFVKKLCKAGIYFNAIYKISTSRPLIPFLP